MKKFLFFIILIFGLSLSLVSAVWWNPFSWGEKKEFQLSPLCPSTDNNPCYEDPANPRDFGDSCGWRDKRGDAQSYTCPSNPCASLVWCETIGFDCPGEDCHFGPVCNYKSIYSVSGINLWYTTNLYMLSRYGSNSDILNTKKFWEALYAFNLDNPNYNYLPGISCNNVCYENRDLIPPESICNDGMDNDCDGNIDCSDSDCSFNLTLNSNPSCNAQNTQYCCSGSCTNLTNFYEDYDKDGYGNKNKLLSACLLDAPTGYVTNSYDCEDNNSKVYPGTLMYPDANFNQVDKVCKICNQTGGIIFSDTNPESLKNCFKCNPETENLEFTNNNQLGDKDCFYCDGLSKIPKLDPSFPASGYIDENGNPTFNHYVLFPSPLCGNYINNPNPPKICITHTNPPFTSDSAQKIYLGFPKILVDDCKVCNWTNFEYKIKLASSEQAYLAPSLIENPLNDGDCLRCISGDLAVDFNDTQVSLCNKCGQGVSDPIIEYPNDPRVNDSDISTSCLKCDEYGNLLNESAWTDSGYLGWPNVPDNDKECCGGKVFDARIDDCCPLTRDDLTGQIVQAGDPSITGVKCCRKQNLVRAGGSLNPTIKNLLGLDIIRDLSTQYRVVVDFDDPDYCLGGGMLADGGNDGCAPCQASKKNNYLSFEIVMLIGGNLAPDYLLWLASKGLITYFNLDSYIGGAGWPRFNRVCFEAPRCINIPFIFYACPGNLLGGYNKTYCGECNPYGNNNKKTDVQIKFPFSNFGFTINRNFSRLVEQVYCKQHNVNNFDTTKSVSADYNAIYNNPIINGCYYCNPEGMCEIQNELMPGWLKYWTKKALAIWARYNEINQVRHFLLDKIQGGEISNSGSNRGTKVNSGSAELTNNPGALVIPTPQNILNKFFP